MNRDLNCECDCGECNNPPCQPNNCDNQSNNCNDPCNDPCNNSSDNSSDNCSTDSNDTSDNHTDSSDDNKSNDSKNCNDESNICKYRYMKHGKMVLDISPPKLMLLDSNYICLYEILYKGILEFCLETQLKCLISSDSMSVYNSFYALILSVFKLNPLPVDGLRLVVSEPDGTVIVDTSQTTNNTFNNWKTKSINENHNSRIAMIDAQTLECGVGYETKHSTTLDVYQYYVAIRGGLRYKNYGTFRLSINVCTFPPI